MKQRTKTLLAIIFFIVLAAGIHNMSPNLPEGDTFFYVREAIRYRTAGLFETAFPWLPYSAIGQFSVASWYGFGILLTPFTFIGNWLLGVKTAGIVLTSVALIACYIAALRAKLKYSWVWPTLFLFSAPNVLYRLLMVRPQMISLALSFILVSLLVSRGKTGSARMLLLSGIFASSFGIVWGHFNFAWLPLVLLGASALGVFIAERRWLIIEGSASLLGLVLGWLLRPHPVSALKLLYIQLVQQTVEKGRGLPLLFGSENFPLGTATLFKNFGLFMFLWLAALLCVFIVRFRSGREHFRASAFLWSTSLLSGAFFLVSVFIARRAYDFWTAFGVLAIGAVATEVLPRLARSGMALIFAAIIFLAPFSTIKTFASLKASGHAPDELQKVALWMRDHSSPGDIVFNLYWPHFSPLYFWNQKNYYVGGLDPIFQYAYSPTLYWKFHYLSADIIAEKTCGKIECAEKDLEDTHDVLAHDFRAKFVALDRRNNPKVYAFLENDPRFELGIESENDSVFIVK